MTTSEDQSTTLRIAITAFILLALLALVMVANATAAENRLQRKVQVMERVLDEVLVQSEHVLVNPDGNARGILLDGYGALFVIEVNLDVEEYLVENESRIRFLEGGIPVHARPGKDEDRESWEEWEKKAEERERAAAKKREQNLKALQTELADTLVDYGATLAELQAEDAVTLVVFIEGRGFLRGPRLLGASEDGPGRMTISARMDTLRKAAAGTLSREAARKQVAISVD